MTSVYDKLDSVLKKLKILEHLSVSYELISHDFNYFSKLTDVSQFGGSKNIILDNAEVTTKNIMYNYHGTKFTFELNKFVEQNGIVNISIHTPANNPCIIIFIDPRTDFAYLNTVSYFMLCAKEGLIKGGGKILIQFAITYLRLNKKKYKINKIVLKDHSHKICENHEALELSLFYFLLYGNTWFGNFGFRPYDTIANKPDITRNKDYIRCQKLMTEIKVSDVPQLKKYIIDGFNKLKTKKDDNLISLLDTDMLLYEYLQIFAKKYDYTCGIFQYFYKQLADDIGLTRFYDMSFYLDL